WNGVTVNGIVRLNSNGSMDTTFSSGTGFSSTPYAIAEQADYKLLIMGRYTTYNGHAVNNVMRMDSAGVRDTTFNIGTGFNITTNTVSAGGFFFNYDSEIFVGG